MWNKQRNGKNMTKPKNFRLSLDSIALLKRVAKSRKMNETEVVEYCVARFADLLCVDVESAALLLQQTVARGAAQKFKTELENKSAKEKTITKLHGRMTEFQKAGK